MIDKPKTKAQKRNERRQRNRQRVRKVSNVLRENSITLALALIIVASGIAVFDGALYSATAFGFGTTVWLGFISAARVFALMPDALMVLSAAKMREKGISPTQRLTARRSMRFGLGFSLFTNMNAAVLKMLPADWEYLTWYVRTGTVVYHAVVVLILWYATETVTKVREDGQSVKPKAKGLIATLWAALRARIERWGRGKSAPVAAPAQAQPKQHKASPPKVAPAHQPAGLVSLPDIKVVTTPTRSRLLEPADH